MPHGRILFPDRNMRLKSGAVAAVFFHLEDIGLCAAVVHKIGGKFQVTFVAGCAIESDESKLDLFMSGPAPALAFLQPENGVDVVRITAEAIQQFPFAETFIACHGGFHQVPGAVKFVRPGEMLPALILFKLGVIGVEVSIFLLGGADQIHPFIIGLFQFRIGLKRQTVRHAFQHLCGIGVPKDVWFIGLTFLPVQAEGIQSAGLHSLFHGGGNGAGNAGGNTLRKNRVRRADITQCRTVEFSHSSLSCDLFG